MQLELLLSRAPCSPYVFVLQLIEGASRLFLRYFHCCGNNRLVYISWPKSDEEEEDGNWEIWLIFFGNFVCSPLILSLDF